MNDAQIWTMIGAFTALMFGMLTVVSTLFVRVVRAEIGGLRHEVLGEIGVLRSEFRGELRSEIGELRGEIRSEIGELRGEVRAEIAELRGEVRGEIGELGGGIAGLRGEMNARFDTMDSQLKGLDVEVHALVKHTFGYDRD